MDGGPIDDGTNEDSLESAAADNELVKFVNKIIIDAYNQGVSDIHVEPYPGKAKTEIRFRKDGTLVPYIEVPASYRARKVDPCAARDLEPTQPGQLGQRREIRQSRGGGPFALAETQDFDCLGVAEGFGERVEEDSRGGGRRHGDRR